MRRINMEVNELISSLRKFQNVLTQLTRDGWVEDFSSLGKAICRLETLKEKINKGETPLSLNISNLRFKLPIKDFQHSIPQNCKKATLFMSLNLQFSEHRFEFSDIRGLNIDIEIMSTDDSGQSYKSAWHLDFHETNLSESFAHPKFHFQFGGKKLRESIKEPNASLNAGELFLVDAPRLIHPPMDIVLAVDFVAGNFIGVKFWKKLRNLPLFVNLHRRSEELLWEPYFSEIFDYFGRDKDSPIGKQAKFLNPGFSHL